MFASAAKILISACVIALSSWLSNKKPALAGFIMALPISTMLAVLFSYTEYNNAEATVKFAKSIFAAIPLSLVFFIPFLLAQKLPLGFWGLYALGVLLLVAGYFTHDYITRQF